MPQLQYTTPVQRYLHTLSAIMAAATTTHSHTNGAASPKAAAFDLQALTHHDTIAPHTDARYAKHDVCTVTVAASNLIKLNPLAHNDTITAVYVLDTQRQQYQLLTATELVLASESPEYRYRLQLQLVPDTVYKFNVYNVRSTAGIAATDLCATLCVTSTLLRKSDAGTVYSMQLGHSNAALKQRCLRKKSTLTLTVVDVQPYSEAAPAAAAAAGSAKLAEEQKELEPLSTRDSTATSQQSSVDNNTDANQSKRTGFFGAAAAAVGGAAAYLGLRRASDNSAQNDSTSTAASDSKDNSSEPAADATAIEPKQVDVAAVQPDTADTADTYTPTEPSAADAAQNAAVREDAAAAPTRTESHDTTPSAPQPSLDTQSATPTHSADTAPTTPVKQPVTPTNIKLRPTPSKRDMDRAVVAAELWRTTFDTAPHSAAQYQHRATVLFEAVNVVGAFKPIVVVYRVRGGALEYVDNTEPTDSSSTPQFDKTCTLPYNDAAEAVQVSVYNTAGYSSGSRRSSGRYGTEQRDAITEQNLVGSVQCTVADILQQCSATESRSAVFQLQHGTNKQVNSLLTNKRSTLVVRLLPDERSDAEPSQPAAEQQSAVSAAADAVLGAAVADQVTDAAAGGSASTTPAAAPEQTDAIHGEAAAKDAEQAATTVPTDSHADPANNVTSTAAAQSSTAHDTAPTSNMTAAVSPANAHIDTASPSSATSVDQILPASAAPKGSKQCSVCHEVKPLNQFSATQAKQKRGAGKCKTCAEQSQLASIQKH